MHFGHSPADQRYNDRGQGLFGYDALRNEVLHAGRYGGRRPADARLRWSQQAVYRQQEVHCWRWWLQSYSMDAESIERDAEGRAEVVSREHFGRGSRTPVSDRLISEDKMRRKQERQARKEQYRKEYQKAFHEGRLERERKRGRAAGLDSWSKRLDRMTQPMYDKGMNRPKYNKQHRRRKSKKRRPVKPISFDSIDNWGFFK